AITPFTRQCAGTGPCAGTARAAISTSSGNSRPARLSQAAFGAMSPPEYSAAERAASANGWAEAGAAAVASHPSAVRTAEETGAMRMTRDLPVFGKVQHTRFAARLAPGTRVRCGLESRLLQPY